KRPVRAVRHADNDHIAPSDELFFRNEGGVFRELVRVIDLGAVESKDLPQLVRQRVPNIVDVGLERHSEDAHSYLIQLVAALEAVHQEGGQPLVDSHCRVAEREPVRVERGELHGVLQQARAGGEASRGEAGGAAVPLDHRPAHPVEVDTHAFGNHVELVGGGELDVPPAIREQLGQLCLLDLEPYDLRHNQREKGGRPIHSLFRTAGNNLRELFQLPDPVALRDTLRTVRKVPLAAVHAEGAQHVAARPGEYRAPDDDRLLVIEVRPDAVEQIEESPELRVQIFVDRRPD